MISVILPIFNAEKYLSITLDSILNQTYSEIEVICINDGSNDKSLSILRRYKKNDRRIIVIDRENKGLIFTLNEGIRLARYDYIARMDADDISHPNRFKKQLSYLLKHDNVAVIGSAYNYIDEAGTLIGRRFPPSNDYLIKTILGFGSPFVHPGVMFNKKLLGEDLYYNHEFPSAEDFELWARLSHKYKFHNLSEILIDYRILNSSISRIMKNQQKESMGRAMRQYIYKCHSNNNSLFKCFLSREKKYIPSRLLYSLRRVLK